MALWVSAKAAADPDTVIKWSLFGEHAEALQADVRAQDEPGERPKKRGSTEAVEIPEKDCSTHTICSDFSEAPDPSLTLPRLIARSTGGIYAGTVIAVTPGFYLQAPAELLTVSVDEVLHAASAHPQAPPQLYLLYGVAHFRIGAYSFCGQWSDRWGEPVAGNRILIFADESVQPDRGFILPSAENQLLMETKSGLYVPAALRRPGAPLEVTTFGEAVAVVRQAVAAAEP